MATNSTPLRFDLPDGDRVELCTWDYVVAQLSDFIIGATNAIALENIALTVIDNKLDEWLDDGSDSES